MKLEDSNETNVDVDDPKHKCMNEHLCSDPFAKLNGLIQVVRSSQNQTSFERFE